MRRLDLRSSSMGRRILLLSFCLTLLFAGLFAAANWNASPAPIRVSAQRSERQERHAANTIITSNRDGEPVVQDLSTGAVRDLTPEEQARYAEFFARVLDRSPGRFAERVNPHGEGGRDLEGPVPFVMLAMRGHDGSVVTECTDHIETAAAFLRIDPELIRSAERRRDAAKRRGR